MRPFALAIVGGSPEACVAVGGKEYIRLGSGSISLSCRDLEKEFVRKQKVKSEEGEMMVYSVLATICEIGLTHDNWEGADLKAGYIAVHLDD